MSAKELATNFRIIQDRLNNPPAFISNATRTKMIAQQSKILQNADKKGVLAELIRIIQGDPQIQNVRNAYPGFNKNVNIALKNKILENENERPSTPDPTTPGKGGKRKTHKRRRQTKKRKHTRRH